MVEQWAKHSKAEKETFQYISKFTRDCPNCETGTKWSARTSFVEVGLVNSTQCHVMQPLRRTVDVTRWSAVTGMFFPRDWLCLMASTLTWNRAGSNFMFCWVCMQDWSTHNFFYSW
jgi:hypothetical protein